jgi:uncharacterized protein YjbJ (UPF0337 family)
MMNWDQIQGDWEQFKGSLQAEWGKLTGDDIDVIQGDRKRLCGIVQKRYGKAREDAEKEIDQWLARH